MPVEKDIDLNKPLTEEDLRQMEEEANRLEELAQDAQEDAKKAKEFQKEEEKLLNEAVKNVEKIEKQAEKAEKARKKIGRTVKEVNRLAEHRTALQGMGGDVEGTEEERLQGFAGLGGREAMAGRISKGRTGFGTGQEQSAMGNIMQLQARLEEQIKKLNEEQKKAEKERRENAQKIAQQAQAVGKIQKGQSDFFAMSRNPLGFAGGRLTGMLAKGGIYGIIAIAVLQMSQQIFEEVKKLYAPGGPFDVRKEMLDRDREMVEMDHILGRRSGRVFFTSDVELKQGAPEYSNTERLRDRTIRFQALHLGE